VIYRKKNVPRVASVDLIDAILEVNPEPCESCRTGIEYMTCWDGRRRCKNCVQEYARKMGWDKMELSPEAQAVADRLTKRSLLSDPEAEWDPSSRPDPQELPRPTVDPSLEI
jgi:hypothetical protein